MSAPIQHGKPFPYALYTAESVDCEAFLSWHLGAHSNTGPDIWVWVIGTGKSGGLNRESVQERCARHLGRMLAQGDYGVMTGGHYHEESSITALIHSYADATSEEIARRKIRWYTTHESRNADLESMAMALHYDRDQGITEMLSASHACVVIGGDAGTVSLAMRYLEQSKPVFSIPETGSAARQVFEELLKLDRRRLEEIYGSQINLSALSEGHQHAIEVLMQFLEMRFRNQSPASAGDIDMKIDFSNIDRHSIPLNDFRLKSRFTDPEYVVLPDIHLEQLKPLDREAAQFIADYISKADLHADTPFKENFFRTIDKVKITKDNEQEIRKWLYHRGLPFEKKIYLSWDQNDAMIVPWKVFIKYFDSFLFASSADLTVCDESLQWALLFFHERDDEIYFGTNQDYTPSDDFTDADFIQ